MLSTSTARRMRIIAPRSLIHDQSMRSPQLLMQSASRPFCVSGAATALTTYRTLSAITTTAPVYIPSRGMTTSGKKLKFSKVVPTVDEAVKDVVDGSTIMLGGFGLVGIPEKLMKGLERKGSKNLTCVSNDCGTLDHGLGVLIANNQVKRMVSSYTGFNRNMERMFLTGQIELELVPQGTLAEKMRAGGAGIPAFFTPAGFGTWVADGGIPIKFNAKKEPEVISQKKEIREFDGKGYVLERSLKGDFAFIKAQKADTLGNLIFHSTARNFNLDCAKAARVCIAEVEEIVEAGELDPDEIHLHGIYVHRVVKCDHYEKVIEKLRLRMDANGEPINGNGTTAPAAPVVAAPAAPAPVVPPAEDEGPDPNRVRIAKRIAKELRNGMYVNLGIGVPTMVANFIPDEMSVILHSENGLLGIGPYPTKSQVDPELINAGKETISYIPGSAIMHSSESFAMIRGKHVNMTVLGGLEVSQYGDLANWIVPGKMVKGMGGAMDLVTSGNKVVVAMIHNTKDGGAKILPQCNLPLTGPKCVSLIVTELAVFEVDKKEGLTLIEKIPEISVEELVKRTAAPFKVSPLLRDMQQ